MSSDRSFLNVYKSLIDNFVGRENIKIVISVRTADLHCDPSLRVYKNVKTVTAKLLNEPQVLEQLSKIGIVKEQISQKLLELLKTPNHLNVFSRIALNNNNSFQAATVQDLYFELWNSKVINVSSPIRVEPAKVKEVLYHIAAKMYESQRITVSVHRFEEYNTELKYLESELLIKQEGKQLQFFHQSFYDFVFSKQFVEKENDLFEYIIEAEQSIHIRSAVKMILGYLRDFNSDLYIRTVDRILWDDQILFHIKHILLSTISSQDHPTQQEKKVVLKAFRESIYFATLFFEQARGNAWFELSNENSLLNFLKKAEPAAIESFWVGVLAQELSFLRFVCIGFLRNCLLSDNLSAAWEFTKEVEDQSILRNILFSIENWSNPISYELLNSCSDFEEIDSFAYYHVLDNIAKTDPEFVLKKVRNSLLSHYKSNKRAREYEEGTLLQNLAKSVPEKLFPILFDIIRPDIEKTIIVEDDILSDFKYRSIDLEDDHLERGEFLYRLLAICLRSSAESKAASFYDFLNAHKKSNYYSILRLLVFALTGNEEGYKAEIFDLFNYFIEFRRKDFHSRLGFEMRVLFGQSFSFFTKHQIDISLREIDQIVDTNEIYCYKDPDSKKHRFHSFWGQTKYQWILQIPEELLVINTSVRRSFLELKRKFPKYCDTAPGGMRSGGIFSPIPAEAHKYMSKTNWIDSFRKYNRQRDRSDHDFFKGGVDELASAFETVVKENPSSEKLGIIKISINDPNIDIKYSISGLRGLSESKENLTQVILLFKELLVKDCEQYVSDLVRIASNLIGEEKDDVDIINFLVKTALRFGDEFHKIQLNQRQRSMTEELVMIGINTPSGSAAHALVHVSDFELKDLIFDTFEKILFEGPRDARAAALYQFAYLMNLDRDRAFHLFALSVNLEADIDVLASGIWSFGYMGNYNFEALDIAYMKMAVSKDLRENDSHSLFIQLYGAYLHDQPNADSLLYTLLDNNKHSCSGAVNDIVKHYNLFPNAKDKNNSLLDYVLNKSVEEDYERLSWSFLNAENLALDDIHLFLRKYVQSRYFTITEYFLGYLTLQCTRSPLIAIELFELAMNNKGGNVDKRFGFGSDNSSIKFIVGAFNALNENDDVSKMQRQKLLVLFDKVLVDYRFKNNAEKILEELL
ncbi:hypothetical protein [Dyadobacter diqingensis]|uniref:hypothetical protein n=1 Tax=Dyadobacter diqingensis TaxID=2938121 RepID=UPI0020C196ED|nr:hypothetical protein [Dyadobacter diqingensis]